MKAITAAAAAFLIAAPAHAAPQTFDATCVDSTECKVTIDGETLTTSLGLTIKAEDIVFWSGSDNVQPASLGWCFWLGAKCYAKEDLRFMIKYMDANGRRQITQIGFFNAKPARSFGSLLGVFSGLQSGQIAGVVNSERRSSALAPESVAPFTDVTNSPSAKPKGAAHVGAPNGSTPAVQYSR